MRFIFSLIMMFAFTNRVNAIQVEKIQVDGIRRVETETILSYLSISPHQEFTQTDIDASLKRLFSTGLFSDVRIKVRTKTLYVKVVERPIISRIVFEGNDKISDSTLKDQIKDRIAVRQVLNRAIVQEIAKDIQRTYQARGRFSASVTPQIIKRPENRVDLIFAITEGHPATIKRIIFTGNRNFSDEALLDEISTKEERWWRFWSYDDIYTPERLEVDKRMLLKFYHKHGYADFKVLSSTAELSTDRKDFFITFVVDEGARYTVHSVSLQLDIKGLRTSDLLPCLLIKEGELLDATLIEKTITELEDKVGAQGYAFADIEPKITLNRKEKTANIIFILRRGPKNFIQRIDIEGNSRTLDSVIRREMQLHDGDPLNTTKMKKSIQNVKDLDFFEDVRVQVDQGNALSKQIVKIDVEEKSTGGFKFGAGVSTGDGAMGMLGYEERNFLGRGQSIELNFTLARRYKNVGFDICQPYFMDRNLLVGTSLSYSGRDRAEQAGYKGSSYAWNGYIGHPLSDDLWHRLGYKLSLDNIEEYGTRRQQSLVDKDRFGKSTCSQVYSVFSYSRLDSRRDPTTGFSSFFKNGFAGIGGNVKFHQHEIGGSYYYPLKNEWVFVSRLRGGIIFGGRIIDRFSLGGDDFHGFETDGIGPREKVMKKGQELPGEAVYGKNYYVGTFLTRIPLGATKELGMRGIAFIEYGSVWGTQFNKSEVYDNNTLRMSAGIGIEWFSPLGPIGLALSHALKKQPYDRSQVLQLTGLVSGG
ncbi:MAG: outer membrane protein assembly factor BamA [Holosporales bacterium]|nr:outer membrane protein assembly factor BamA [Holosporales bacterium]